MIKPLISIYTPTYNRNQLLRERALTSVLNQTYKNWEYIVVSDGPNPELKMILDSYDDPRIKFYEIERQTESHNYDNEKQWCIGGIAPANYALDKIKGDYIARLDDDDIWTPDHLERSLEYLLEHKLDFITSRHIVNKGSKAEVYMNLPIQTYLRLDRPDLDNPLVGCHSSWFYSAKWKHFKYDPECYKKEWNRVSDPDLLERMYLSGVKVGFLNRITTVIKNRPGTTEIGLEAIKDNMELKENEM